MEKLKTFEDFINEQQWWYVANRLTQDIAKKTGAELMTGKFSTQFYKITKFNPKNIVGEFDNGDFVTNKTLSYLEVNALYRTEKGKLIRVFNQKDGPIEVEDGKVEDYDDNIPSDFR